MPACLYVNRLSLTGPVAGVNKSTPGVLVYPWPLDLGYGLASCRTSTHLQRLLHCTEVSTCDTATVWALVSPWLDVSPGYRSSTAEVDVFYTTSPSTPAVWLDGVRSLSSSPQSAVESALRNEPPVGL